MRTRDFISLDRYWWNVISQSLFFWNKYCISYSHVSQIGMGQGRKVDFVVIKYYSDNFIMTKDSHGHYNIYDSEMSLVMSSNAFFNFCEIDGTLHVYHYIDKLTMLSPSIDTTCISCDQHSSINKYGLLRSSGTHYIFFPYSSDNSVQLDFTTNDHYHVMTATALILFIRPDSGEIHCYDCIRHQSRRISKYWRYSVCEELLAIDRKIYSMPELDLVEEKTDIIRHLYKSGKHQYCIVY